MGGSWGTLQVLVQAPASDGYLVCCKKPNPATDLYVYGNFCGLQKTSVEKSQLLYSQCEKLQGEHLTKNLKP
jgi:hypothetical protein